MKFKIPFTKDKVIDFSLKSQSTFYSLNSGNHSYLIGADQFTHQKQSEQKLIDDGYGSNVSVYAIIKKIAQNGADIPLILRNSNNPEEEITTGEVFDMLQNPAIYQGEEINQYDYIEILLTYILSSGNIYQRGLAAEGFGDKWQKMEVLPSGIVVPNQRLSYLDGVQSFKVSDKNNQYNIDADEILHTKFVNPTTLGLSSLEGLSPLQASLYSLTGSSDIQKAISIMVKNQGSRGILTNKGERPLTQEEALQMKKSTNQKISGLKNFNSIHVTGSDVNYLNMGMSATDLKLIESGVLTDRQLCNAYSVPSVLFNDPANSTYNNYTTALKSLYTDAVLPVMNKVLSGLNQGWLSQFNEMGRNNFYLEMDKSSIEALQADQKEEAEKDKILMEGVSTLLNMPISDSAKSELLQNTYGYTEEMANAIAQTNIITNE